LDCGRRLCVARLGGSGNRSCASRDFRTLSQRLSALAVSAQPAVAHRKPVATSVMPVTKSAVSSRVSSQLLRILHLNCWTVLWSSGGLTIAVGRLEAAFRRQMGGSRPYPFGLVRERCGPGRRPSAKKEGPVGPHLRAVTLGRQPTSANTTLAASLRPAW